MQKFTSMTVQEVRLEKTEGAVSVALAGGKTMNALSRMRLLGGYTVTTGAGAKAYLGADESKIIIVGANSAVAVTASPDGKKLEVKLTRGEAQLTDGGAGGKASNTVLGIRG